MENQNQESKEEGNPYMGNIWGWKVSLGGLVLLLAMMALIAYGHYNGIIDVSDSDPFPMMEEHIKSRIDTTSSK